MSETDDEHDEIDERPREAVSWRDVSRTLDERIAEVERRAGARGVAIPDAVAVDVALAHYAQEVLAHGNSRGRENETMTLPKPWSVRDIIAIIGMPDVPEPGSDEAWRRIRRGYDARSTYDDALHSRTTGRTR